jgi:cell division septation protein DedD
VDLLTAAPAQEPVPPPATGGDGGYLVQVSSQRSEDQALASFASMQSRFPSILGGIRPTIQRADLGEQGIYYRVRIGPWTSRAEATEVCERLQAAGGDCFVAD